MAKIRESERIENVPKHVAIIMDGNGRWAKRRGLARKFGHKKGVDAVRATTENCIQYGVKVLSLYAFSTENWSRPETEVKELFGLIREYFEDSKNGFMENGVQVRIMGDRDRLDSETLASIERIERETKDNCNLILNIGFNYGSRDEILSAVNRLLALGRESVTKEDFEAELYTAALPDPDLLIRTSGEQRLSNFMLYQCAYSELYFTDAYWPDFDKEELKKALLSYSGRERRFGKV